MLDEFFGVGHLLEEADLLVGDLLIERVLLLLRPKLLLELVVEHVKMITLSLREKGAKISIGFWRTAQTGAHHVLGAKRQRKVSIEADITCV